jgi:NADPH2:quinone reductase
VNGLRIGDRVAAYLSEDGGYAETCVVPAQCVIPLPPSIQLDVAAAFPVQALTAYFMLHLIGRVQPGWVVLIHAVGGGVGLCLTQLAVKAGAKVIGSVGAAGKERRPLEFGASRVVNREEEDFVAAALEMTGGRGVDLLLDSLGALTLDRSFAALRALGHAISYGEAEGRPFPNLWERMVPKSLTLTRFHMGHVQVGSVDWRAAVSYVLAGIVEGWLRIPIEGIYPLREAAAMHGGGPRWPASSSSPPANSRGPIQTERRRGFQQSRRHCHRRHIGIGSAIARHFAMGASLVLTGRSEDRGRAVEKGDRGGRR